MRYKNGREAKPGDRVLWLPTYRPARLSSIYDVEQHAGGGHAKFVVEPPLPLYVNLKECLHIDDVLGVIPSDVPDVSASVVDTVPE